MFTVFHWNIWLALILGALLACALCGVLFFEQAEDTDSWLRSFNLVEKPHYMVAQLDFTPETEVFNMVFDR